MDVEIEEYAGSHRDLTWSFLEAEDSEDLLATATADIGSLRFYQRCDFRMTRVVQDAFGPARGYPPGIEVDGIPMLDQGWFERLL
jgi:hypothetical protein